MVTVPPQPGLVQPTSDQDADADSPAARLRQLRSSAWLRLLVDSPPLSSPQADPCWVRTNVELEALDPSSSPQVGRVEVCMGVTGRDMEW